jgi:hypothetical protein
MTDHPEREQREQPQPNDQHALKAWAIAALRGLGADERVIARREALWALAEREAERSARRSARRAGR